MAARPRHAPGERKSAVVRAAIEPLLDHEFAERNRASGDIDAAQTRKELLTCQRKVTVRRVAKIGDPDVNVRNTRA